ncbi:MAG TPA: hypothetical protein VGM30_10630 [Puia sp.]|jgi:hypothetical protein
MLKAIVIDPVTQTIKEIKYEPECNNAVHTTSTILGFSSDWVLDLKNGDNLYAAADTEENENYLAFRISSTGEDVFGKAVIVGFPLPIKADRELIDCRSLLEFVIDDVVFCTSEETATLRAIERRQSARLS